MKHLAVIQAEFVKTARKWKDLSYDEQKRYIKRHPKTKRRLTAKPRAKGVETDFNEMIGSKRIVVGVKKLNRLLDKINKNYIKVPRAKVSWVLEKALNGTPPRNNPKTYDLREHDLTAPKTQKIVNALNRRVNRLVRSSNKLIARQRSSGEAVEAVNNYIKQNFVVLKDAKPVKSLREMREFKAPKVKVEKVKRPTGSHFSTGDRVKLRNGIEGTIVRIKYGHKWTTINVTTDDGKHWHTKHSGTYGPGLTFIGKTSEKDAQRIKKVRQDFDQAINNRKQRRTEEGREKINLMSIHPGDTIMIKGHDYNWSAEVVSVDYRKGGVRINQLRSRRQRPSIFNSGFGSAVLQPGRVVSQHYRFIPAVYIVSKSGKGASHS